MFHDNDLSSEFLDRYWWTISSVSENFSSLEFSFLYSLKLETNIVSWEGFFDGGVMHLNGLALGGKSSWG